MHRSRIFDASGRAVPHPPTPATRRCTTSRRCLAISAGSADGVPSRRTSRPYLIRQQFPEEAMNRRDTLKFLAGATAFAGTAGVLGRGAAFAQAPAGPFKLPPLGYAYDALEPNIDTATMTYPSPEPSQCLHRQPQRPGRQIPRPRHEADRGHPLQSLGRSRGCARPRAQQPGRPLEPHLLLGPDDTRRRQGSGRRSQERHRPSLRRRRQDEEQPSSRPA